MREKYQKMKDNGATPEEVYNSLKVDGHNLIISWQVLMSVFQLSIAEAKNITIVADKKAASLSDYQEQFIEPLRDAFEDEND